MERDLARLILKYLGITADSTSDYERLAKSVASIIRKRCGHPIYPQPHESLALSVMRPKTAALSFDKVYRIPILNDPVPEELGFYCATRPEIGYWGAALVVPAAEELGINIWGHQSEENRSAEYEERNLRFLSSEFRLQYGIAPTIFYHAPGSRNKEFRTGPCEVLTAAVSNVAMVDEEHLTWEQIIEFRKDTQTRTKYRRLVRWVDEELRMRSPAEVEDLIAIRLDDYEWALKKHGLKALIGTLSCLLDPKFLGGASATVGAAALAGGSFWAALAGASLAVGRAIVSFGTGAIDGLDERRKENYEVAYVHEIKKRLG